MGINVLGLSSSRKTPGAYLSLIFGGPGTSAGSAQQRVLLLGNMIPADITGASPSFTLPKGTAALATPLQLFSERDAINYFGRGSELHLMAKAAFDQAPDLTLWACAVGTAGGAVQAAQTLALTGTAPTADLTVTLYCDGKKIELVIAKSTTTTAAAAAIAAAINDLPDLPITAQNSTGTVTFTAKTPGARGNTIRVRVDVLNGTTLSKLRTGSLAATVAGTIFTLGAQNLAAGSGTETTTFATALAAIAAQRWHRIACSVVDATNIAAAIALLTTKAGPTQMLWEQILFGNTEDFTTATVGPQALAAGANFLRAQILWHRQSDRVAGIIAAQAAAGRLMGDASVGGSTDGESSDPSTNLDGLQLATIPVQELVSDQPLPTEIETALNYGVTPLVPSASRPGYVEIARSITTRFKDDSGATNYAVLDTSEVTIIDACADEIRTDAQVAFKKTKLVDDDPTGKPSEIPRSVSPSSLRSWISAKIEVFASRGWIINTALHASKLAVERDTLSRGRANADIPLEPAPGFHIFGANVRQQQAA